MKCNWNGRTTAPTQHNANEQNCNYILCNTKLFSLTLFFCNLFYVVNTLLFSLLLTSAIEHIQLCVEIDRLLLRNVRQWRHRDWKKGHWNVKWNKIDFDDNNFVEQRPNGHWMLHIVGVSFLSFFSFLFSLFVVYLLLLDLLDDLFFSWLGSSVGRVYFQEKKGRERETKRKKKCNEI